MKQKAFESIRRLVKRYSPFLLGVVVLSYALQTLNAQEDNPASVEELPSSIDEVAKEPAQKQSVVENDSAQRPATATEQSSTESGRVTAEGTVDHALAKVDSASSVSAIPVRTKLGFECIPVQSQDEIWRVSARNVNPCDDPGDTSVEPEELVVQRWDGNDWVDSCCDDLSESHNSDTDQQTVVFIHGNRNDKDWSLTRGMEMYQMAFSGSTCDRPPLRWVIWQWRSERELVRPIIDYKIKSRRSVMAGNALVTTLKCLGDRRVMLVGYSLGAQVISAAMSTPFEVRDSDVGRGYRIAMIAAAMDCGYWSQCCQTDLSWNPVESTFVFRNQRDRIVRVSEMICRREQGCSFLSVEQALDCKRLDLGASTVFHIESEIGRKHALTNYLTSGTTVCKLREMVNYSWSEPISQETSLESQADLAENEDSDFDAEDGNGVR